MPTCTVSIKILEGIVLSNSLEVSQFVVWVYVIVVNTFNVILFFGVDCRLQRQAECHLCLDVHTTVTKTNQVVYKWKPVTLYSECAVSVSQKSLVINNCVIYLLSVTVGN